MQLGSNCHTDLGLHTASGIRIQPLRECPVGRCSHAGLLVTQAATAAFKTLMALMADTRQWEALTGCVTRLPTGTQVCCATSATSKQEHCGDFLASA